MVKIFLNFFLDIFFSSDFFPGRFDTSGFMIRLSVPEIEGGTLSVTEKEKKKEKEKDWKWMQEKEIAYHHLPPPPPHCYPLLIDLCFISTFQTWTAQGRFPPTKF